MRFFFFIYFSGEIAISTANARFRIEREWNDCGTKRGNLLQGGRGISGCKFRGIAASEATEGLTAAGKGQRWVLAVNEQRFGNPSWAMAVHLWLHRPRMTIESRDDADKDGGNGNSPTGGVFMLPDRSHPVWEQIASGKKPVQSQRPTVNLLLQANKMSYERDQSPANLRQLADKTHHFFSQYEALFSAEIAQIFR